MTHATSTRRAHGEDSIYWDATKNRYVGAIDLGLSPAGTRIRKKVMGKTKTEVRDKLRELHKEIDAGVKPRRRYTVGDALEDWLAHGQRAACRVAGGFDSRPPPSASATRAPPPSAAACIARAI